MLESIELRPVLEKIIMHVGKKNVAVTIWQECIDCFSAGVTIEEALQETVEAIQGHLEILAEDGENIPLPGDMLEHQANPDFKGAVWCGVV